MLVQNLCFFCQDTNPSDRLRVFHCQIESIYFVGDTGSDRSLLDQMLHFADVGTGKDTVGTRLAFFVSKVLAFWQLGDTVSRISLWLSAILDFCRLVFA